MLHARSPVPARPPCGTWMCRVAAPGGVDIVRHLNILPPRFAGVAQLVEHFLAKEDVASSSLVTRSLLKLSPLSLPNRLEFQPWS